MGFLNTAYWPHWCRCADSVSSYLSAGLVPLRCLQLRAACVCRFSENPLVKGSSKPIRFYAGAPLIASNGKRLGAL